MSQSACTVNGIGVPMGHESGGVTATAK